MWLLCLIVTACYWGAFCPPINFRAAGSLKRMRSGSENNEVNGFNGPREQILRPSGPILWIYIFGLILFGLNLGDFMAYNYFELMTSSNMVESRD